MKHYVVVCDWCSEDFNEGVDIVAVCHSYNEAINEFTKRVKEEKQIAEDNGWQVFVDTLAEFQAYEAGNYHDNHTYLYIEEVK